MMGDVLDQEQCYVAVQSRDRRFDGWFVTAVRTTGIYCRPSCPAITPKRANVDFFPTSAAAQQQGFRACKRCRPDASPGSPEWNIRQDVIGRAMRLIADGVVERDGVQGLARRLGYSERHLNRLMTEELGAGPLAVARAQRAHTARLLIETTTMSLTDVAFAAGFGSVRQFNDTMRHVFASAPSSLRTARSATRDRSQRCEHDAAPMGVETGTVRLRLPTRSPFAGDEVLAFVGGRAIPGVESWDGTTYRRALALPHGHGIVNLQIRPDHVAADMRLASLADLGAAVQRVRRLLDLDADPEAVDHALSGDPAMAALVASAPGRRSPGSTDAFETCIRAIVGQQVSVAGATTVASRLVVAVGEELTLDDHELTHVFASAARLADVDDAALAMPAARRDTVRRVAAAVADESLELDVGVDADVTRQALMAVKGIGPWTADYVVMRGLSHPDVFLTGDLGVRHGLDLIGGAASDSARWAPWRSYAVHQLWASLAPVARTAARRDPNTNSCSTDAKESLR
jgi:AraC family transcriptional regulator, regulatory protein of adaptative response / DNA-3-methyladenine glycosylase II